MLAKHGDLDGLRALADAGDWLAALRLAGLLAEHGDLDGRRARATLGKAAWKKLSSCDGSAWPRTGRLPAGKGGRRPALRVTGYQR